MMKLLALALFTAFAWTSFSGPLKVSEENPLDLMVPLEISNKTMMTELERLTFDGISEAIEGHQAVSINTLSLLNDSFKITLFTGEEVLVKGANLSSDDGKTIVKWADYENETFVNLRVSDGKVKGDIHIGYDNYAIRPMSNGDGHIVTLSSTAPMNEEPYELHDIAGKSIWGGFFRADLLGLGKDGIGTLSWSGNTLNLQFDRNLDGVFDVTRNYVSNFRSSYGNWTTAEFGDWDGDGRDGMLMAWYVGGNTRIEFYRDYTPVWWRPNQAGRSSQVDASGFYNQILAGVYGGNGPCDRIGDSLTFVRFNGADRIQAWVSCRNPLNVNSHAGFQMTYLNHLIDYQRVHSAQIDGAGQHEHVIQRTNPVYFSWRYNNAIGSYEYYGYGLTSDQRWLWGNWYGSPNNRDTAAVLRGNTWLINYDLDSINNVSVSY